ncbi:MAG: aminopeptidase P family protein [bacterium]
MTRLERLIEAADGWDSLILTDQLNQRYITGFTGSSSTTVVSREGLFFITDSRYLEQASLEVAEGEVLEAPRGDFIPVVKELIGRHNWGVVGFEANSVTVGLYDKFRSQFEGVELVGTQGAVESMRTVKDEGEIAKIKRAVSIADEAFSEILGSISVGMTEKEVADELVYLMRRGGASKEAFDIIVASGARSSIPHGIASNKVLERGDFVKMDFGCVVEGYNSDITRTIVLGDANSKQREVYDLVRRAQEAALAGIRSDILTKEADGLARKVITEAGYGKNFGHGLGHGVGLAIHELPRLRPTEDDNRLKSGMVVTVEPGIYIPQWGGVRIEDMVVVRDDGCEILTKSSKDLIVL